MSPGDTSPVVSLTTPFFNAEKYLAEAIESVLAQTYRSWEYLLVDDGSRDGSTAIAQRYAREWPDKIRILEHPNRENRGMTESRNLGLRNSRGRYIARMDADDVMGSTTFEDKVRIMEAHPTACMVYGPVEIWHSWRNDGLGDAVQKFSVPLNTPLPPPTVVCAFLRDDQNEPFGMFVRREVMESVGGYTAEAGYLYEDLALNVKICMRYSVIAADLNWYRYRQHKDQYCFAARAEKKFETGRLRFLEWVGEYFAKNGVRDEALWAALGRALVKQRALVRSGA